MENNIKKSIDFIIAMLVFVLAILELISWWLSLGEAADIRDVGNNYLVKNYPLINTIGWCIVGFVLVVKSYRFKSCIYTKIVSWLYFIIQGFNLSALILEFGSDFYDKNIYPVFLFSIFGLIILKITRWVSLKHS